MYDFDISSFLFSMWSTISVIWIQIMSLVSINVFTHICHGSFFFFWRTKVGISLRTGERWMYEQKAYTYDTNTCKQANR